MAGEEGTDLLQQGEMIVLFGISYQLFYIDIKIHRLDHKKYSGRDALLHIKILSLLYLSSLVDIIKLVKISDISEKVIQGATINCHDIDKNVFL